VTDVSAYRDKNQRLWALRARSSSSCCCCHPRERSFRSRARRRRELQRRQRYLEQSGKLESEHLPRVTTARPCPTLVIRRSTAT